MLNLILIEQRLNKISKVIIFSRFITKTRKKKLVSCCSKFLGVDETHSMVTYTVCDIPLTNIGAQCVIFKMMNLQNQLKIGVV